MILRATFANITPQALAERIQGAKLSGSVFASIGAGDWGIEHGATFEWAGPMHHEPTVLAFVRNTLVDLNEQAAYVTIDGWRAKLVWQDRIESLT